MPRYYKLSIEQSQAIYSAAVAFRCELAIVGQQTDLDSDLKWLIIEMYDEVMLYPPLRLLDEPAEVGVFDEIQVPQVIEDFYHGIDICAKYPDLMWLYKTNDDVHNVIFEAMAKYNDTHDEWLLTNWLTREVAS